jgi:hypothetical protein
MRMSKRLAQWTICGLAVSLAVVAGITLHSARSPALAQLPAARDLTPAELSRLQRLQGQFLYDSGPSRTELWKTIEVGTAGLEPAQARRTRAQLEQLLAPPPVVELTLGSENNAPSLAIQEGRSKVSASPTGDAKTVTPKGARQGAAPLVLSQRLEGAALLRVVEGNGFRQERRFSPNADASRLRLEIRVSGGPLARPLSAVHVYSRQQSK